MSRTTDTSLPAEKTDRLLVELHRPEGIVGMALQRGASLKPPNNVLTIHATNEDPHKVEALLAQLQIGEHGSVLTSEPRSLISPSSEDQIEHETKEASWPEMASRLRREADITSNYLMAVFFAGVVFLMERNTIRRRWEPARAAVPLQS